VIYDTFRGKTLLHERTGGRGIAERYCTSKGLKKKRLEGRAWASQTSEWKGLGGESGLSVGKERVDRKGSNPFKAPSQ